MRQLLAFLNLFQRLCAGKEIARGLAKQGLIVLMGSRDADRGEAAVAELQGNGKVVFIQLDVTSDASVKVAVSRVTAEFSRLDILVNNSGALNSEQNLTGYR